MIEFVCTPLPVRIAQQGCHGNHAFSHSPNVLEHFFFSFKGGGGGGAGICFGTNEKYHGGAR